MKRLIVSNACKKDIKRLRKRGHRFEVFYQMVDCLKTGTPIPAKHRRHKVKGKWVDYWECHIVPDWLLMWKKDPGTIYLARTGSHSDLFK